MLLFSIPGCLEATNHHAFATRHCFLFKCKNYETHFSQRNFIDRSTSSQCLPALSLEPEGCELTFIEKRKKKNLVDSKTN